MAKFTTAQYDALVDAIAKGITVVKYTDKVIEYRSLDEMLRLLDLMEKDLGLKPVGGVRLLAKHSKGLC